MTTLREALARYLEVRRALGTKLREPGVALAGFLDVLEREGATFITTELALRWACKPQGVQPATLARRLTAVRGFAAWVSALDPRTEVPPRGILPARRRRPKPYIYTDVQVGLLMAQAARLRSPTGLRALTYTTLIGLLAATGLRPGEALALDVDDVDLQDGILKIRETKFGKTRLVPVDDTTRLALAGYARRRDRCRPKRRSGAFLVDDHGDRLLSGTACRTFVRVSRAIGLRQPGRRAGRGPRLQDLRHTFATRRLIEWYRAGLNVGLEMPKLSTYLGHVNVCHTYWYIEAVPELLQLATERLSPGGPGEQGGSR